MITKRETALLDTEAQRLLTIYEKGQHASLILEVDELSKRGPLTPGTLGMAALALTAMERYDEAVKAANNATQQEPRWAWLHHALALAEAKQKRLPVALAAQRQAAQLMPGEPAYLATLAQYQREAGEPEQAVRTANQALMLNQEHPVALNQLGLALRDCGDPDGALAAFQRAQAADATDAAAYLNEGALHLGAGARAEARKALHGALARQPGLVEAEDLMAESLSGPSGPLRATLVHLLSLGRVTLFGWLVIAFFYYVGFRVLQMIWKAFPATLPTARVLLLGALVYLMGGMLAGRLLRYAFHRGKVR